MSEPTDAAVTVHQNEPMTPAEAVMALVERGGEVAVDAMERMFALEEKQINREAKKAYAASMCAVQEAIRPVVNDSQGNQRNRYAKLNTIVKAIEPIYTANGFSVSYGEEDSPKDGCRRITIDVIHDGGHEVNKHLDAPLETSGSKSSNAVQALGSTVSYLRRYLLAMVFNVTTQDMDDDAATAAPEQTIDADQAGYIQGAIDTGVADGPKLLKFAGVATVAEIPASVFSQIKATIERRASQ